MAAAEMLSDVGQVLRSDDAGLGLLPMAQVPGMELPGRGVCALHFS